MTGRPCVAQLHSKFSQSPLHGGWNASVIKSEILEFSAEDCSHVVLSSGSEGLAEEDCRMFARELKRAGTRRGTVAGEVPSELLRVAFFAHETYQPSRKLGNKLSQPIQFVRETNDVCSSETKEQSFDPCRIYKKHELKSNRLPAGCRQRLRAPIRLTDAFLWLFKLIRATDVVPVSGLN